MPKRKILFTHSYMMVYDQKQLQWNKPYAPLGTIQAAAVMRSEGFEVDLFDVMFIDTPEEIQPKLETFAPDYLIIYDDGFNYLTKMCLSNMQEAAWRMAQMAQQMGIKVIACSSNATDHYGNYLNNGVDFVILGEGEMTLLDLVNTLENEGEFTDLPGIAYLQNGSVRKTSARPVMKNLDELPMPAWDLVDIKPYRDRWMNGWGYFSINVATTRGCPYKCNWCAKPIYGNSYKMRSTKHVVAEIKYLKELFDFDHIWFCDDIFGLKRSWVIEFADLVEQEKLQFEYKIQSRADLLVKDNYVEALARSGCREAWMGVESGSQRILDAMDKGITLDQVAKAVKLLRQHNIRDCFFIQFGYLSETGEDIKQTIEMIGRLLPHDIGISVSYPLPGTGFFDMVKQDLKQKTNWVDSGDMDLMFQNTYSAPFYKELHHYVHQFFRRAKAKDYLYNLIKGKASIDKKLIKRLLGIVYYTFRLSQSRKRLKAIDAHAAASL